MEDNNPVLKVKWILLNMWIKAFITLSVLQKEGIEPKQTDIITEQQADGDFCLYDSKVKRIKSS